MQYQTIVLEMIRDRPKLHEALRKQRKLLKTVDQYAKTLRQHHFLYIKILTTGYLATDPTQVASEALELAIKHLERHLPTESDESPLTLDAAMAFISQPSQTA